MQINRLFEIIYLLLNKKTMTASALAKHFEVSPRTIYRDVELLSSSGIPIYMTKGKGGGISLLSDFVLNKAVLTENEKTDILSALHAIDAVRLDNTDTALKKISSLLGNEEGDWIEVDFSGWANAEKETAIFTALKKAILKRNIIKFSYYSSNSHLDRIVEPLKLVFKQQDWYLYGYCQTRKDYRFFKLKRIQNICLLEQTFTRLAPKKVFDAAPIFQEEFVTLTLKLSKEMAYRVYDEFSDYTLLPDGGFLVTFSMPKGAFIYSYIASFGEHCEILQPLEVRLQVKEKLQKTLSLYL